MFRFSMRAGAVSVPVVLAAVTIAGAGALAQVSPVPARTVLAGTAVPFTRHARAIGDVPGPQRLTVQLWLRSAVAAAERYATAAATPGSGLFHRYLSPAAYTARFAASPAAARRIGSWLREQGFTGVSTDPGRSYVRATGPVSRIDAAFGIRLEYYQQSDAANAGRYALRANNRAVSLPAALAGSVLGVSGLDNALPVLPLSTNTSVSRAGGRHPGASPACSQYYGEHETSGLPRHFGTTRFPTEEACGYTARQLRAAYGASTASTGRGQTVALVEEGLTRDMFLTLHDYAKADHMPAPSATRYEQLSLGRDSCGDPFNTEEQLDVEAAYDMAPGAHLLVVAGDSCAGLQGVFDADTAIIDGAGGHPLASVASNSWESGTEVQSASVAGIENAFLVRAAAEGVGMYFSAGDNSGVQMPSSDPYGTAVGGTTLGIGASNDRLFETGWSTGYSLLTGGHWTPGGEELGGSGGGPSKRWKEPAYQKGVVPPALTKDSGTGAARSVPDISADADVFTGLAVGLLKFAKGAPPAFYEIDAGGTSASTPLVAGMVTAAQQGQAIPFGFLNPVLYKLHNSSAYHATLPLTSHSPPLYRGVYCPAAVCGKNVLTTFDDQNPTMSGYTGQVTLKGYDNMTGLGTPNGPDFIRGLRALG